MTVRSRSRRDGTAHQGLFFERLCVPDDSNQPTIEVWRQPLVPGVKGLYYNRNRWYSPQLGRFLQRDMNETALLVRAALATNGEALDSSVSSFNAQGHYGDGMNLYQYVGSNPVNERDALGLFSLIELMWTEEVTLDENLDSVDRGMTLMDAFRGLAELIQERNLELDEFAAATGEGFQDEALADFQQSQLDRSRALSKSLLVAGAAGALNEDGLPRDFHTGPKNYTVYIGSDKGTGRPAYVGVTNDLSRRRKEWKHLYELDEYATGLTKKEARAIEQLVMERNPHFRNINNAIDARHKWFRKAVDWASDFLRGKRKVFR